MSLRHPENLRFKCVRCGLCCGDTAEKTRHVLLLKEEAVNIASSMNRAISDFAVEVDGKEPYVYEVKKTPEAGKCCFLEGNRCTIYSKRPLICRFYPFGLETIRCQKAFYFTIECPGIGEGKVMRERDFSQLLGLAEDRVIGNSVDERKVKQKP
jgi:uncharacterized protein